MRKHSPTRKEILGHPITIISLFLFCVFEMIGHSTMTENMDKKKRFRASKPGGDFLEKSLVVFHVFEHLMKPQLLERDINVSIQPTSMVTMRSNLHERCQHVGPYLRYGFYLVSSEKS